MKTFLEALNATMFRAVPDVPDGLILPGDSEYERVDREVSGIQDKYSDTLQEIQTDPETLRMINAMVDIFEDDASLEEMMAVAFSHGVMVGIEMEKAE
jgi:hypothetical protein